MQINACLPWDVMEEKSEAAAEVTADNHEAASEVSEFKPGPRSVDKLEFINDRGLGSGTRTPSLGNSCGISGGDEGNEEGSEEDSGEHG